MLWDWCGQYEKVLLCPLSSLQRRMYELFRQAVEVIDHTAAAPRSSDSSRIDGGVTQRDLELLQRFGPQFARLNFKSLLMELRKLCNHPFLVLESMSSIPDEQYFKHLVGSSGKLWVLQQLLEVLVRKQQSKVLVFSQMTTTLDVIQGFLQVQGIACSRLDGQTRHEDRLRQLSAFNRCLPPTASNVKSTAAAGVTSDSREDSIERCSGADCLSLENDAADSKVFLLSTRAGGVGINLQSADTVIMFDSDWNPQQDLQAISRAHRIGQSRPVLVLRLISVGPDEATPSVEQHLLRRAMRKLEAGERVLARGQFDMGTVEELNAAAAAAAAAAPDAGGSMMRSLFDDSSVLEDAMSTSSATTTESAADSEISTQRHPSAGPHQQTTTASETILIDSLEKIHVACQRSYATPVDETPAAAVDGRSKHGISHVPKELQSLMSEAQLREWDYWLAPGAATAVGAEECDARSGRSNRRSGGKGLPFNEDLYWAQRFEEAGFEADESTDTQRDADVAAAGRRRGKKRRKRSNATLTDRSAAGAAEAMGAYTDDEKEAGGGSSGGGGDDDVMQEVLPEQDICALCGEAWVTADHLEAYCDMKIQQCLAQQQQQQQHKEGDSLTIASAAATVAAMQSKMVDCSNDIANMMILCDGCDGSYHMICVGE